METVGASMRDQMPLLHQNLAAAAFFAVAREQGQLSATCGHLLLKVRHGCIRLVQPGHMPRGLGHVLSSQRVVVFLPTRLLKWRVLQTLKEGQMLGGHSDC